MDILEPKPKADFDSKVLNIVNRLKFRDNPVEFKGSSSLKSQRFFSDYDLFSNILKKVGAEVAYSTFYKILQSILSEDDIYFTEFKVQNRKGQKYKWFPNETFDKDEFFKLFRDIDFAKLDVILWTNNRFIELSIIYNFIEEESENEEIENIKSDINDLKKEKNYFKILKRFFSIFRIKNDNDMLLYLTDVFNSQLGEDYQKLSNLEAIKKVMENYDDERTKKRIELNLKEIGVPEKQINKTIKKLKSSLSKSAKKIYEDFMPKR